MVLASPLSCSGGTKRPWLMRASRRCLTAATDGLLDDVPGDEGEVGWPFGESAHEIRIPLRPEGNIHPHPVAFGDELFLEVAADAVEHLELVAVGRDLLIGGELLRGADDRLVVRG